MIFENAPQESPLFAAINTVYREDENETVNKLLQQISFSPESAKRIYSKAEQLVIGTRVNRKKQDGLDSFLQKYSLSSEEGIALMCMAEALLRIPDKETIDKLISDKLSNRDWEKHINISDSLFVNAATWSLMLTGKLYAPTQSNQKTLLNSLRQWFSKTSTAVIRPIILQGMKIIGKQYVMGRTIEEALERSEVYEARGYRYSYDMLGEAARTKEDADIYFKAYEDAIAVIGTSSKDLNPINGPGISIKLSALHPRYEVAKRDRVHAELTPRLLALAQQAKAVNIGLTVDAEEADRLMLSLEIFEKVFLNDSLKNWEGLGLAVQSYQKRAPLVLDWLQELSQRAHKKIMVRLIKGAYWDTEIKQSQVLGLEGYPVFTRKNATDVSFLVCAQKILNAPQQFYAQFGTHNAHSLAAVLEMAGSRKDFEFQCLHGMGQPLYDQLVGKEVACRIYAPVGSHKELLGYLVRRLLENGANTSFINRIADDNTPVENILVDPIAKMKGLTSKPHPLIPIPRDIFKPERLNSKGLDLSNTKVLIELKKQMEEADQLPWASGPMLDAKVNSAANAIEVISPTTHRRVGTVSQATTEEVEQALQNASDAFIAWSNTPVNIRAECLEKAANLLEANMPTLMTLLTREAGKQIVDCVSEIREAVDFCRYYAVEARKAFTPKKLPGPTGELNQLSLFPRGVIVCISPWNFPAAIFMGQIVAALVTGNTVIAKPAEQTPLIAAQIIEILHKSGVPAHALQLLPGRGEVVGAKLVEDERVAGIMFTGSTETAKKIQLSLAKRSGPIVPLIAETGGQNAMIVDSSALPEQVVMDILGSAFNSAGQRCSALRVLFLQEDIADKVLTMLKGAMAELTIGDPCFLSTDVGPVIDADALEMLQTHANKLKSEGALIFEAAMPNSQQGHFFAPCIFELQGLSQLPREVFGPILHVIRYQANDLDKILQDIKTTGYGLTLGIHSRIDAMVNYVQQHSSVGNIYVNRNMIGAVVGVQPFGGEGLSGTGPKAGGPHYLPRLCVERSISINTTAAGGNTTLVSLNEDA